MSSICRSSFWVALEALVSLLGGAGLALAQGPPFLPQETVSLSPNTGQYSNQIPRREHSEAYTEVCFRDGTVESDQHTSGESTNGGNCAPGDIGWIIERDERPAKCWDVAKAECL
jgi:hypothetical protein